jgi:hypothetical protein
MVQVKLRKLGVLSMGLVSCLATLFIGVIGFIIMLILNSLLGSVVSGVGGLSSLFDVSSGAIFFLVVYPILGFISGIIGALIYNLVAKIAGGLKLELEELE